MKRIISFLIKDHTRSHLAKLLSLARQKEAAAVLMYGSPDPDAIASAMALREILKQKAGIRVFSFFSTEAAVRQQNIELMRVARLSVGLLADADPAAYPLVAVVDAQPSFFGDAIDGWEPDIVIDHHPRAPGWHAPLEDVREQYGALATVLTEYLLTAKVRIPRMLATALLYAIKTDTNNFERQVVLEDFGAYHFTFARANRQLVRRIEFNQIPERFLKYYDHAIRARHRWRDRIICYLGKVESFDACVQVADFFLHVIDIAIVIIAGIVKDKLIIVLRGDGYRRDCGAVAEDAFGNLGNAGGHKSAARVEISLEKMKAIIPGELTPEAVNHFLVRRMRRSSGARPGITPAVHEVGENG